MKSIAYLLLVAAVALTAAVASSDAPPTPSVVPISWQLEFDYRPIESITIVPPGQKEARTYWYILFTVTNKTKADQVYVPSFDLCTETGQILRAGENVPSSVFKAIVARHNNPLLTSLSEISGRILQGEDNAKDGVAIWENFDPDARKFQVFVGGLSGERAVVKLPAPVTVTEKDDKGQPRQVTKDEVILAKTLHLSYSIPGEAPARPRVLPELLRKAWIMR
ncbi:MAG TPA: hypothetical protein VFJ30_03030 [Phycisphaerae bacterium]|nr:hypothetical protein [Phycisphaerae bacterium]